MQGGNGALLAALLVALLKAKEQTITTAESITGGRMASAITGISGSSAVFPGSVVSYADRVKRELLGVPQETLDQYGAVSEPVAKAMAEGAAKRMGTDMALAATGLAGPDGDGVNSVGTVYLALHAGGETVCEKHAFSGDRASVQEQATQRALEMALELLQK